MGQHRQPGRCEGEGLRAFRRDWRTGEKMKMRSGLRMKMRGEGFNGYDDGGEGRANMILGSVICFSGASLRRIGACCFTWNITCVLNEIGRTSCLLSTFVASLATELPAASPATAPAQLSLRFMCWGLRVSKAVKRCTSKLDDGGNDDGDGGGDGVNEEAEKKPSHVTPCRLGSSRDYLIPLGTPWAFRRALE
eukprot:9489483-Pyramimonas_sp.AAC.1